MNQFKFLFVAFALLTSSLSFAGASELDCYGDDLGEKSATTQCLWEQKLVDVALEAYEPDEKSYELFCGYNNDLPIACRSLIKYKVKGTDQPTDQIFEEWFINPRNNVRWRGFFVKVGSGYNLVWSDSPGNLNLKKGEGELDRPVINFSNKGQRNLDVTFDSEGYPSFSMAYVNVDPTKPVVHSDFEYNSNEVVINKYNLVDGNKVPVENNSLLKYQKVK